MGMGGGVSELTEHSDEQFARSGMSTFARSRFRCRAAAGQTR